MPGPVVHQHRHTDTLARMGAAWVGRWLGRRARRHLDDGLPQLAHFGFEHVGRAVTVWGSYERDEHELLRDALQARGLLTAHGLCLDIGANIGNHAMFFAPLYREVWAFEPNPRTFTLLQLNAQLAPNVRCFNLGLSDVAGIATLSVPAHNIGMATLQPGAPGVAVPCTLQRLDDLPGLAAQCVALVKIDVEGHEPAALRGALAMLRRDRPVVVFEQLPEEIDAQGSSPTMDVLRQAGYAQWWTLETQRAGASRWLNLLRRLCFGEVQRFVECDCLARRFHTMVVALPGDR